LFGESYVIPLLDT